MFIAKLTVFSYANKKQEKSEDPHRIPHTIQDKQ